MLPSLRVDRTADESAFRDRARAFVADRVVPNLDAWTARGGFGRELFHDASTAGLLCLDGPPAFGGGGGVDFRRNAVLCDELHRAGDAGAAWALVTHAEICAPYLWSIGTPEQQERWLGDVCTGRSILAIAMSEPATGSDLASIGTTAERIGDRYVLHGAKTFISNGVSADLVIVAVRTDRTERHRGLSLLVVERDTPGFGVGRALRKVGLRTQDTAELHFDGAEVPVGNLLGAEGEGFYLLMRNLPRERLVMAVAGLSLAQACFDRTVARIGRPVGQHARFRFAEMHTALQVGWTYLDRCVAAVDAGGFDAADAAAAKWWATDVGQRITEGCFDLLGDPTAADIGRFVDDARVQPIYGGTNEIMKEIVGRSLGV